VLPCKVQAWWIITNFTNRLYQKPHCFSLGHSSRIDLASNGKKIDNL